MSRRPASNPSNPSKSDLPAPDLPAPDLPAPGVCASTPPPPDRLRSYLAWVARTVVPALAVASIAAGCGGTPTPTAEPPPAPPVPTQMPTAEPLPPPIVGQPRPLIRGRIGQSDSGAAPCATVPADLGDMLVVLAADNADGICNADDYDDLIEVTPDAAGAFVFPAELATPPMGPAPTAMSYCIKVDRAASTDPGPLGPIVPGTNPTPTFAAEDICVEP